MDHHFFYHRRTLDNAAVRGKITLQHGKASCLTVRIVHSPDYLRILIDRIFDILRQGIPGYCHTLCMHQTDICQLFHNCIYAASLIQILHIGRACRCKVAQVRCLLADLVGKGNVKIKTDLMGNSRKMQHGISGTAQCHVNRQRI